MQPQPLDKGENVPKLFRKWAHRHNFIYAEWLSKQRDDFGCSKYGHSLMTEDGRDSVKDALDEVGDLNHYLMKMLLTNNKDTIEIKMALQAANALIAEIEASSC